jgi:hypothetical protein
MSSCTLNKLIQSYERIENDKILKRAATQNIYVMGFNLAMYCIVIN